MKQTIRQGVFETNSSSTHSLSISKDPIDNLVNIPENGEIKLVPINPNDADKLSIIAYTEREKLNLVAALLESICYSDHYTEDPVPEFNYDYLINHRYFKWLSEAIYEKSNTVLIFNPNHGQRYNDNPPEQLPIYGSLYDDEFSADDIFTAWDDDVLNVESKFKKRIIDIIYDPAVTIKYNYEKT